MFLIRFCGESPREQSYIIPFYFPTILLKKVINNQRLRLLIR